MEKRNKILSKIMALGLAGVMMLGMSTVAFAEGETPATATTTFDVPITQTLYFKNVDGAQVYEPNIQYTYTITPGSAGKTVTDNAGVSASVKAGDMRGFGLTTKSETKSVVINFSSDHAKVTADKDGKAAVTKKVTVAFDGSKIVSDEAVVTPGVYRYILTQTTTTDNKKAVGIEEVGTQDKTLVLDVTVKNDGTTAGARIQDPSKGDDPEIDNKDKGDENGKTTGFGDPEQEPTDPENPKDTTDPKDPDGQLSKSYTATDLPSYYDVYTTYNLTVKKTVEGAMGDKSNKFPFSTAIANSVTGAAFDVTPTGGAEIKTTVAADTKVVDSLKHGESTLIEGLPKNLSNTEALTATTTETNNTADTYKVKAMFGESAVYAETDVAKDGTAVTSAMTINTATEKQNVEFTNTLNVISPTGFVMRFAPYLLMLAGAIVLVMFTRRRKAEEK